MLSLAGVLGDYQPRIHLDPATEDCICLKGIVRCPTSGWRWSTPFFPREKERQSQTFSVCLTLELRTLGVLELHPGGNTASYACFLAKRACMKKKWKKKKQQICSLWVAWKLSWPSKIVLWFIYDMGFEGYLIGCWFCVFVLSALFVSNCCFQSARLCLSVSVLAKPFLPTRS